MNPVRSGSAAVSPEQSGSAAAAGGRLCADGPLWGPKVPGGSFSCLQSLERKFTDRIASVTELAFRSVRGRAGIHVRASFGPPVQQD